MERETLFNAFDDLKKMADQMEQEFFELVSGRMKVLSPVSQKWKPLMDIYEIDDTIVIKVEIPGVKKEDISILQERNRIVITGKRALQDRGRIHAYHQMEINYGEFERTIVVSENLTLGKVTAEYQDGFLLVKGKKRSAQRYREIKER